MLFLGFLILIILEEMRDEGIETASPGEPLMMGARRNEVIDVDTHGFKVGGHLARTEVLLTSAAHKEVVHLTVKLLCSCKDTIETCLDINGKEFYSQPSISPNENISVQNFRPGIYLVDIPRFGIKKIIVR